jgi:hypothetical protein
MTSVRGSAKVEFLPEDHGFVRFIEAFPFYSDILGKWGEIPKGFICDLESVPVVKGSNPEPGSIHDYFSRYDSVPVVDKDTAAAIYKEFQQYYDERETGNWFNRVWDWIKRLIKTEVVEWTQGYFHKHPVMATYDELVR